METLIRNATLTLSRRLQYYEALEGISATSTTEKSRSGEDADVAVRTWSRRKRDQSRRMIMPTSFSYRRDRAKKRLIFLRSYQLSALESPSTRRSSKTTCWGFKKVLSKAKGVVMRPLSFSRIDPFKWCRGGGGVCAPSLRAGPTVSQAVRVSPLRT